MLVRKHSLGAVAIASAMVLGTSALAESAPCTPGFAGGMMYSLGALIGGRTNPALSAIGKTTFDQKLVDGTSIHYVVRTRQARDSAGRTMTEIAQGCERGEDGQMHQRLSVSVSDPVARTSVSWQVGSERQPKVANVFHQPDPQPRMSPPSAEELAKRQKGMQAARAAQLLQQKEFKNEDLGVKQINGFTAQGTRSTRTIPIGEEGNDQPLIVMNETWRSEELNLMLLAVSDDPRRGRTTMEYEELNLGEPDPAVFSPPAGYTVQERSPDGAIIH